MSLHYLVKLEIFVTHVLHWVVTERNSKIYPTLTVASKFARFESNWLQHVRTIARKGVKNTHPWSGRTETATENGVGQAGSWIMSSLRQPFVSGVICSSRSMMSVLYTFSCSISHVLLSTGFKSSEFGDHSCSRINSGVSFGNNW